MVPRRMANILGDDKRQQVLALGLSFARITSGSGGGDCRTRDGQNTPRQPDHARRHAATDVTVSRGAESEQ